MIIIKCQIGTNKKGEGEEEEGLLAKVEEGEEALEEGLAEEEGLAPKEKVKVLASLKFPPHIILQKALQDSQGQQLLYYLG